MEMVAIKVNDNISTKNKLKELSLKTKDRREKMKNFVFTKKDDVVNENFKDLEKEIYSTIK